MKTKAGLEIWQPQAGFVRGELTMIASPSGKGKSIFLDPIKQIPRISAYTEGLSDPPSIESDPLGDFCFYDDAKEVIDTLQQHITFLQNIILSKDKL